MSLKRCFSFSTGMICGIAASHAALVWTGRLPGWSPRNLLPAVVADLGMMGVGLLVAMAAGIYGLSRTRQDRPGRTQ